MDRTPSTLTFLCLVCLYLPLASRASAQLAPPASFRGLGFLPNGGDESEAIAISSDGSTVVGVAQAVPDGGELDTRAFLWRGTSHGGGQPITSLGDLPGRRVFSRANGVSGNGGMVVGVSESLNGFEAFAWMPATGMVGLGDLAGGIFDSQAYAVSPDGRVIVGASASARSNTLTEAFRWTQQSGMLPLGDLPGGAFSSFAFGISADGATIVGAATSALGTEAFRWTAAAGMVSLGDLPGGVVLSKAYAASANGSVIVGYGTTPTGYESFVWSSATGMVNIGDFPGGITDSYAYGVSADGRVAVGYGTTGFTENFDDIREALIWTRPTGILKLKDVLIAEGQSMRAALTGWELVEAYAVSADGLSIVGTGTDPQGHEQAWIAHLSKLIPDERDFIAAP